MKQDSEGKGKTFIQFKWCNKTTRAVLDSFFKSFYFFTVDLYLFPWELGNIVYQVVEFEFSCRVTTEKLSILIKSSIRNKKKGKIEFENEGL